MTPFIKLLLAVLLSFSPYYGDKEDAKGREDRLARVAVAVSEAVDFAKCTGRFIGKKECEVKYKGDKLELAAVIMTIGRFESAYAKHVHEHKCNTKSGECDGGRARSPWQFQRTMPVAKLWDAYKGSDQTSTTKAAWAATIILLRGFDNCKGWQGAFAQYATGSFCTWKHAQLRYHGFIQILNKLKAQKAIAAKIAKDKKKNKEEDDED